MSLNRYRIRQQKPNYFLALLVFVMCVFGLLMIYSASVVESYQDFGYNYYFLNRQAVNLAIGIVFWIICAKIDYKFWQKSAFWLFLGSLFLLVLVFIPGLGMKLGGSSRWINLGFFPLQPSEIAKLTFILYLAAWLSKKGEGVKNFQTSFMPFAVVVGLLVFLVMKEPDMGTTIILSVIAVIMFFVAGGSIMQISLGAAFAGLMFWILIKSSSYRWQRLMVFFNPNQNTLESGYHINQALLAIGSGGLLGLGFGQSKQKYLYLPEPHIDSIFAIITEELGFLRAMLVVLAFLLLGYIGYKIAKSAPDTFSRLVATGITTWFVFQAFLNISTMIGLVPLTGVPLPFISYGGSSLIISLAAVGIMMNISKHCNQ